MPERTLKIKLPYQKYENIALYASNRCIVEICVKIMVTKVNVKLCFGYIYGWALLKKLNFFGKVRTKRASFVKKPSKVCKNCQKFVKIYTF